MNTLTVIAFLIGVPLVSYGISYFSFRRWFKKLSDEEKQDFKNKVSKETL